MGRDWSGCPIQINEGQRLHGLRTLEAEHVARDNILRGIWDAVNDDFLILVNTTEEKIPRWAEYINGTFMQTYPVLEIPSGLSTFEL